MRTSRISRDQDARAYSKLEGKGATRIEPVPFS